MKRRKYEKSFIQVFLFLTFGFLLSGCNSALLDPKGKIGLEERSLILTAFCLMLIIVIPAIFLAINFAWKYHEKNKNSKYNPNWSHSKNIEIIVWSIPILIISILAVLTWKSTHLLEPSKPLVCDNVPITIEVISMDWKWFFIYPDQGIATINEIAIPVDTPIKFKVTSNSVMNSFFIPNLGSQIYAMAGMQTTLYLIANEPGIYDGISASYSGSGFSGMKFKVIATLDYPSFKKWTNKVKESPKKIENMSDFEKIASPSENNEVEYFSNVRSNLFIEVINKFMDHNIDYRINKQLKNISPLM